MLDVQILRERLDIVSRHELADKDEFRWHLGASVISDECDRKTQGVFRWLARESFDGRMMRLFKRGKDEEHKLADWLDKIGVHVTRIDPATGKQFLFSAISGHYGGSWDGEAVSDLCPEKFIVEYKTHNDKSFKRWQKQGVRKSHPKHFAQMGNYAKARGLMWALYVAINKDTDEIDFEFVETNATLSDALTNKAGEIITAKHPMPKISATPTDHRCKMCFMSDVCHYNAPVRKNCRSCVMAEPAEGGEWKCNAYDRIIPRDFVPLGCDSWRSFLGGDGWTNKI